MFDNFRKNKEAGKNISSGQKWWLPIILTTIFVLLVLICGTGLMFFETYYSDKFFPGTHSGGLNLSGLNKNQVFTLLEAKINNLDQSNLKLQYLDNNETKTIIINNNSDPDLTLDYFTFDLYQSIYNNFEFGRNKSLLTNIFNQLIIYLTQKEFPIITKVNSDYVLKSIQTELGSLVINKLDARPSIKCPTNICQIEVLPEQNCVSFNYDEAIKEWESGLRRLNNNIIKLEKVTTKPEISRVEVANQLNQLTLLFTNSTTPEFSYQDKKFELSKKSLATMMVFVKTNNQIKIGINQEAFLIWFNQTVAKNLDIEAQNATLQIKDGNITNLSTHKNGQKTDSIKAYTDLNNQIMSGNFSNLKFSLIVDQIIPEVSTESVNDLGIDEILGTGESNFTGSPTNRIKNIKNGASKLNGRLIKPGEEFSLIKNLLPVDAANGYFPELVIKGNKTTPEYGGGLCQVGTTLFRAVLATGLPVLERQNHSYSVTYYLENGLPGVDATIYDPKPDFRFKNDTANYILIQARVEGSKLYFDFWGTKDGRSASRTKPKTWGLKKPEPTKLIETTTLKPGEKKCTESSHNGISASFDYIVAYNDGKTVTSTFTSVYKPWQAVCLVGVSGLASTSTAISTSTIDN